MAIRLLECHRILKETGSLYLHCDPTMSHYLKTTLDCIFGEQNFRNEIAWCYRGGGVPSNAFARKHDVILFYTKTNNRVFNKQFMPYSEASQALVKSKGGVSIDGKKRDLARGAAMVDWWSDLNSLQTWSPERTGYPTQKPLALLARIIKTSTNEGDIVLDPFCGCATTCVAAEHNNRKWIGIDVSAKAYDLVKERLDSEVARPQELPAFRQEIHRMGSPPKRTDVAASVHETKHVYIISHPKYPNEYKVGIAKNVKARLNTYQTSDPDRRYKLEFSHATHLYRQTESYIHEYFENKHEWVRADLNDIKREIRAYAHGS